MTSAQDPKQRKLEFPSIFLECLAKTTIFEVSRPSGFFWTGRELRKPNFELFHQTCSLLFQQQLSENHSCFSSLEETSPWDPAHVKERRIWRPIASTRALYDQMAPQLGQFEVFNFLTKTRPTTIVRKP